MPLITSGFLLAECFQSCKNVSIFLFNMVLDVCLSAKLHFFEGIIKGLLHFFEGITGVSVHFFEGMGRFPRVLSVESFL